MEFLLVSQKKNRTWILLKQLFLLLLRMTAIAGIVLLAGGPHLRNQLGGLFGSSMTHHVVLLDDSFSMSDRSENVSVFDEAKKVVQRIAKDIGHEGSQTFSMLRFSKATGTGRSVQPDLLQVPVDNQFFDELNKRLSPITVSQTDAGPAAALEAIEQLLGQSDGGQRIVYLISDFRARQWNDPADLKKQLRRLSEAKARLFLINCQETTRPNLAIMDLAPGPGTRAAGVPLFIEVTVQNFGPPKGKGVIPCGTTPCIRRIGLPAPRSLSGFPHSKPPCYSSRNSVSTRRIF